MFVAERSANTQFSCANVCMIDMKTCFFRQEDIKQIEEKAISSGGLRPPVAPYQVQFISYCKISTVACYC